MKERKMARIFRYVLCWFLTIVVVRADLSFVFQNPADVAVTESGYTASGSLSLSLNFAPTPGQNLTVVKNTGMSFISGTFDGIPQGAIIPLTFNGVTYHYIANYYGGNGRSLVLQWPQTAAYSWGSNQYRQLGNGGIRDQPSPVPVWMNGGLASATVTKVAAGENNGFALTADGRLFGWGYNLSGELGSDEGNYLRNPTAVSTTGVLASKIIVDVVAGSYFTLALDSTGKAYGFGANGSGQLGTGNSTSGSAPVAVDTSGVLAGKTLVALAAGYTHSLAVSSEGKVYGWGSNVLSELTAGATSSILTPIAIDDSGVLAGRVITAVAAGSYFSLALANDGRIYSWGANQYGQLGDNSQVNRTTPVAVDHTGVLFGKAVVAIAAGSRYCLALTSDGLVHAWGEGVFGNLGNNSQSNRTMPVTVDHTGAMAGKFIVAIAAGDYRSMALASDGSVFEWGSIQGVIQSSPRLVSRAGGWSGTGISAIAAGSSHGLVLATADPPRVLKQPASVKAAAGATVSFHAAVAASHATHVKWQISTSGESGPFVDITGNPSAATSTLTLESIGTGMNGQLFRAVVSNESGVSVTNPATLSVVDWTATLSSAGGVAFEGQAIFASGVLDLSLGFSPSPGTDLTVIRNAGTSFISGRFANLPQGATISLTYGGLSYDFVANYFGGNGRSLVLQWKRVRMAAWGDNHSSKLGDGTETDRTTAVAVSHTAGLAGKTVVKVCAGSDFGLALTADGRVFAWGSGSSGTLGTEGTTSSSVPVEVTASGPLAGKTVISIATGSRHCLALTDNGRVYSWGSNGDSQLGLGYAALTPTLLDSPGVFGGKPVIAISAGQNHSMALTTDGRVYAWGANHSGQTGVGMTTGSTVLPTEIITSEVLAERAVMAIEAGYAHSLALAEDGTLFSWGDADSLGSEETFAFESPAPVRVKSDGVLSGVSFADLAAASHSLACADDGRIFSWGPNSIGVLGTGDTASRSLPVELVAAGSLAGRTVIGVSAGLRHSVAHTSDGECFAWGLNDLGQLGNGGTVSSSVPVQVMASPSLSPLRILSVDAGSDFTLARADQGSPVITMQPSSTTAAVGATVVFQAQAADPFGFQIRWQRSSNGPTGPFSDITGNPSATTSTLVLPEVQASDNATAYRAVFVTSSGSAVSEPANMGIVNWSATLTSVNSPPYVVEGALATGNIELALGFAPLPGTNLTVIRNTGPGLIDGFFGNLPHGGRVTLFFNGNAYDFIADYYGGNGRSLVLRWPWTSLAAWGANSDRQLGDGSTTNRTSPVSSQASLSMGKSMVKVCAGDRHNFAVRSDGLLFGWGINSGNQTGVGGLPSGPIQGKIIASFAAGRIHNLAVCSDGTAYAWGTNFAGVFGDGTSNSSNTPVAIKTDGVLAGRKLSAVSAGDEHSLALTADGRVFSWGFNIYGQLGNGTTNSSNVPLAVSVGGVLAGRKITAIAAGSSHSLALSSEGLVYSWGWNDDGQLGDNSDLNRSLPVPVVISGALAGKTVVSIDAGSRHSLALTSDGMVYAWGRNTNGQLGDGTTNERLTPVAVIPHSAWAADPIVAIAAGGTHSLALSSSGIVYAWGGNSSGQLGNGSTSQSNLPTPLDSSGLLSGRRVVSIDAGGSHGVAMIADSGLPVITASPRNVTCVYASSATAQFSVAVVDVFAPQIRWQRSVDGVNGPFTDITDNPTANSASLVLEGINATSDGHAYRAIISNNAGSITTNHAMLKMIATGGTLHFPSPSHVPVTDANMSVSGELAITLGFAPVPGTRLTVLRNSSTSQIAGSFVGLEQGSLVSLPFDGRSHSFLVDYFGENGRSLVLHWAIALAAGWGDSSWGQVGSDGISSVNQRPLAVTSDGVLAGETLVKLAAGTSHSLALAASGRIFAWGDNTSGRLGNSSTTSSRVPVRVTATGLLNGKTVVNIAAGGSHSLALTSDGQVATWGSNSSGQLGIGGSSFGSAAPVAVSRSGVLANKLATDIAAGNSHSVALLSDGTLVAWGANSSGQLGTGNTTSSALPVAVLSNGALAGIRFVAIAAGANHTLALSSDGRVYSWGSNQSGQLGRGFGNSSTPEAITGGGMLGGQPVIAIAAGASHSLALAANGRVFAWGLGSSGQLGIGNTSTYLTPTAVSTSGVLSGKSIVAIAAGANHSLAIDSNGSGYAWGSNFSGQLGNNSFSGLASSPVSLSTQGAIGARPLTAIAAGGSHSLAIAGRGTAPTVSQTPTSLTVTAGNTVTFTADGNGYPAPTVRWQRSTTGPTGMFTDLAGQTSNTLQLTNVTTSQSGHAFRAVFTNLEASSNSTAAVLTVQSTFATYLTSRGLPANSPPLADTFQTGAPLLLAYAFDVNPAAPDRTRLPTVTVAGGRLRISYVRWKNAADLQYTVEACHDLSDWQSGPGITETVSVTSIDNSRETVVEQEILPDFPTSRFLRVRVVLTSP